ncbi:MAG: hypothetical protein ABJA81_13435 [Nocardioidaceae bacterium]
MPTNDPVEQALRDLAEHLPTNTDRDLSSGVVERINSDDASSADGRPSRLMVPWRPVLVGVCLMLVAAIGLVSPVRDAAAAVLELVGIDIRQAEEGASPPAPSPPVDGELGTQVPVGDISEVSGFTVPQPRIATLGEPDEAYLLDGGDHQAVTMVWRHRAGIPVASASGASALLTVFHGGPPEKEFLQKVLFQGSRAHQVSINGDLGVFVDGPQTVIYLSSDRDVQEAQSRLSGNSLIWQQDGLTLRLESELEKRASLAIARSVN